MPNMKKQELGDKQIHLPTYNALIDACESYLATRFDPKFFVVQDTAKGKFVSMKTAESSSYKQPFDLSDVNVGGNNFTLDDNNGGVLCRILGTAYTVTVGSNVTLTDGVYTCTPTPDNDGKAYCYLAFDRKNLTITINANDFFPELRDDAGDHREYIEYRLLWMYENPSHVQQFDIDSFIDGRNNHAISGMI